MARLEYFIVCRSVSSDIETDEITLSNVLEDLFLEELPTFLPRIVAVSSWRLDEDELEKEFQASLSVVPPGETAGKTFPMNLARGRKRYRAIQQVLNVPLTTNGELKFEALLNGEHQAHHVVTVHPPATGTAAKATESPP